MSLETNNVSREEFVHMFSALLMLAKPGIKAVDYVEEEDMIIIVMDNGYKYLNSIGNNFIAIMAQVSTSMLFK
ncbi:hypothetical protein HZI73_26120 (plasmid) [Vallitalea pronyensis]|uniref:Uncharacterized protein n=1 Tax=Vallitalea pronyensis TaxID=1348613 RepID=A0A8J8MQE9_9FIRM|nr:hypothetical protein [Vallitalea pronyensis]QUI25891.1 hypothetical protein HZI73_26120 [Vallitalea pronyensis]